MNDFSHLAAGLIQYGLIFLIQTSLVLGLGLGALHLARDRDLNTLSLLCRLLLIATLSLPVLSLTYSLSEVTRISPLLSVSLPHELPARTFNPASAPPSKDNTNFVEQKTLSSNLSRLQEDKRNNSFSTSGEFSVGQPSSSDEVVPQNQLKLSTLSLLLTASWIVGAVALLIWQVLCHGFLWRWRRQAHPVVDPEALTSLINACKELDVPPPLLLGHPSASSPFLSGLLRPAIILPLNVLPETQKSLRAVFTHEATHLKRRDLWWNTLTRVACALLWPQPLIWILYRRIEQINEDICDTTVLQTGWAPKQYAKCLLDWAQMRAPQHIERMVGAGVLTGRSSLARRVQLILSNSQSDNKPLSKRMRWGMLGIALTVALSLPFLVTGAPVLTNTPRKSSQQTSPSRLSNSKQEFDHFISTGSYRIYVSGASHGILQNVIIKEQDKSGSARIYLARTLNIQAGKTASSQYSQWMMNDGTQYTFDANGRVSSEMRFKQANLNVGLDSDITKFLNQQAKLSEPISPFFGQKSPSDLALPVDQINALTSWANGRSNASISGRALDENGRPIVGAKIRVSMDNEYLRDIIKLPDDEGYVRLFG